MEQIASRNVTAWITSDVLPIQGYVKERSVRWVIRETIAKVSLVFYNIAVHVVSTVRIKMCAIIHMYAIIREVAICYV